MLLGKKKSLTFLTLLFTLALPFFANEDSSVVELPEEFEGVQDVLSLESGEAMNEEITVEDAEKLKNKYESFVDSLKKIRMLETGSDIFSASVKSNGKRLLTSFANGKIQRRFYDEDLRLDKIEYWKMSSSTSSKFLERTLVYNPANPKTGLRSIFEKNYSEMTETRTFYHSDGRIKSRRKNFFDDKNALLSFEIFVCSYDSKGRILQERLQKYDVDGQSVTLSSDELNVTKYSGEKISETSYYKNSILRVRDFYTDQENDERVRATYFDGGVIVRDFYRGNIKVSSTIDDGDDDEN